MYVIFQSSRPHIALASAETLPNIAKALMARLEPDLTVCMNRDGLSRGLDAAEQHELDAQLYELRRSSQSTSASPR
jgi:hypothetical protein